MKRHPFLLLSIALAVGACSPKRLSPVVLQDTVPAKSAAVTTANATNATNATHATHGAHSTHTVSSVLASAASKAEEIARAAARRKKLAAQRRAQARKMAVASYEAGRQLLRESQTEPALRAFREAVRLNSRSAEAWMGIAYVCELTGNTKDAMEAFREAKKLWGM
jgi:Flp pilus assembly protein TadD